MPSFQREAFHSRSEARGETGPCSEGHRGSHVSRDCVTSENRNAPRSQLRGLLKTMVLQRLQVIPDYKSLSGHLNGAVLTDSFVQGWEEPVSPRQGHGRPRTCTGCPASRGERGRGRAEHHSSRSLQRWGDCVFPAGPLSCHLNGTVDRPSPIRLS